jgi:hypothetical protein
MKSRDKRRIELRHPIEATVACHPFTSRGTPQAADAVMRNFSDTGSYIESTHAFEVGTVIQVRLVPYPSTRPSADATEWPRSVGLATVRWRRPLADEAGGPYGFGLKHMLPH